MNDSLGDRMKGYENSYRIYFPNRLPVIIRVDGRAFHTFTRDFEKPFDPLFMKCMQLTAVKLCSEISGCKLGYVQSDEISLLVTNDDCIDTQPWFGNNLQKLVSLSASIATLEFNAQYVREVSAYDLPASVDFMSDEKQKAYIDRQNRYCRSANKATFDSRAFILPPNEVGNYFVWRQQDASRNSVQMLARSLYSHKELHGKKACDLHELMMQKGVNWNDLETSCKRGTCIVKEEQCVNGVIRNKWVVDNDIPIFTQDTEYIQKHMVGHK